MRRDKVGSVWRREGDGEQWAAGRDNCRWYRHDPHVEIRWLVGVGRAGQILGRTCLELERDCGNLGLDEREWDRRRCLMGGGCCEWVMMKADSSGGDIYRRGLSRHDRERGRWSGGDWEVGGEQGAGWTDGLLVLGDGTTGVLQEGTQLCPGLVAMTNSLRARTGLGDWWRSLRVATTGGLSGDKHTLQTCLQT